MRLTISEIASAVNAAQPIEAHDLACGVTWDSREVRSGDLYVALPGERVDGHDFAASAVAAGACAVLASREVRVDAPVILVADTQAALADLARYWRSKIGARVVGLTGSTGKTTTKNLVRDVLSFKGSVVATKANQNNELGVPNTLLAVGPSDDYAVVEMGMRGTGQIAQLCACAAPDWGLVTNAGESHIELLGSRQAIARAKAELLEALPQGGVAFVNAADEYVDDMRMWARLDERGVHTVLFSGADCQPGGESPLKGSGVAAVWAEAVQVDSDGCPSFTLCAQGFETLGFPQANGKEPCALQLRGLHNVSNAASAAAVGLAAGMTLGQCCRALAQAQPEKGRQLVCESPSGVIVVDDSYNANPDSMRASLATFAAMKVPGRRIAVLGDMLELGDFAQECHERIGRLAAESLLDALVCVGPLSRHLAGAARAAGMPSQAVVECADAREALGVVRSMVRPGDAVLAKASHSVGLDQVAEGLVV